MQNNYRDRRVHGWRTLEYITKMMNAFWFPFPRFPPRWYAGAGAHYHKALICQTPQRLSAKVPSVSPWNSGRTWDRKRAGCARYASEGSLKDTSIGSFSRAVPIWQRILPSLRYKCMPMSRLSRDGMNLSVGRRYRSKSQFRLVSRVQDLIVLDWIFSDLTRRVSMNGKGKIDPCDNTRPEGSKSEWETWRSTHGRQWRGDSGIQREQRELATEKKRKSVRETWSMKTGWKRDENVRIKERTNTRSRHGRKKPNFAVFV